MEEVIYRRQESSEIEQVEELYTQMKDIEVLEKRETFPQCQICVREIPFVETVAVFLCFKCELYVCENCFPKHKSHEGMREERKESEKEMDREKKRQIFESEEVEEESERKISLFLGDVFNEDKTERIEKFDSGYVSIFDRINIQYEMGGTENCRVSGLCVLENERLVVCDSGNFSIEIFSLGSKALQRYIRFDSRPWAVTEILVNQNYTEPNLASARNSEVSVTDRAEQDNPCLIAITLPWNRQIVFVDVSKKPALSNKVIHTEKQCFSIKFYEGKIFTVGCELHNYSTWSVYILSTDGDMLNTFDSGIEGHPEPYLAVNSGLVYLTDLLNHKVKCRSIEGQVTSEITFEGSSPKGISVDPYGDVYLCLLDHNNVYKLDFLLTRCKPLLEDTTGYIEAPHALCYYRDKLFISHFGSQSLDKYVTVVQLL